MSIKVINIDTALFQSNAPRYRYYLFHMCVCHTAVVRDICQFLCPSLVAAGAILTVVQMESATKDRTLKRDSGGSDTFSANVS